MSFRRDNVQKLRSKLSPEKQALLKKLLRGDGPEDFQAEVIKPRPDSGFIPLSFSQRRLWFLDQLQPGSLIYNLAVAVRLEGDLDAKALELSIEEIIRRHEALRTTFFSEDGTPFQKILDKQPFKLPTLDLTELKEGERESVAFSLAVEQAKEPFDLSEGPLLRVCLMRLSGEDHLLQLTMHHIISDGWSMGILVRETASLYQAFCQHFPSPLADLPLQYADFAWWQNRLFDTGRLDQDLSYWKVHLRASPPLLELPTDRPRRAARTTAGAVVSMTIGQDLWGRLNGFSKREGVTLFMTLMAGFKVLLHRYTGQEDLLVGTPIANRNTAETEGLIGLFVNTLVIRTGLSAGETFLQVLKRVREVTLEAYAHQDLPFDKLVDELQPERTLSWAPVIQVMFGLQNFPLPRLELGGLKLTPTHIDTKTAIFDLTVLVEQRDDTLGVLVEYNTDLFEEATVERMVGHWVRLLEATIRRPDSKVQEMEMLSVEERHQLLEEWGRGGERGGRQECVHRLIEEQARERPKALAVVYERQEMTYEELDRRGNQVGRYLRRKGAGPETVVGLCVERSVEAIVGMVGVLKAGAAYVPLDATYPRERIEVMVKDAGVGVVLTQSKGKGKVAGCGAEVICMDEGWDEMSRESGERIDSGVGAGNLAYVIYTSGSTGNPKGVMVEHGSLVSYTATASERYGVGPSDRVLQFCSLSFDISGEEIYPCLSRGGTLVLRTEQMMESISKFLETSGEWGVSVMSLPTAYWHEIVAGLESEEVEVPPSLRIVIIAGERVMPERLAKWRRHVKARPRLINTYGPTEATISVTMCELTGEGEGDGPERQVSIGRVIEDAEVYILDHGMGPVAIGVGGEIYIGGALEARGYVNEPGLTAEKFIPNPHSVRGGERVYRSGDKGRYVADGSIEFIGRVDEQVKIRGYRVELGEVEGALNEHASVREAVVLAREEEGGQRRLVGYVVAEMGQVLTIGEMRRHLRERLPEYMVPSAFVMLDKLPMTANGKVDRKGLTGRAVAAQAASAGREARTETERLLAGIWAEVLGVERVGAEENFFDIGGHSLLATQVVSRIRNSMRVEVPVRKLFDSPTVAELADSIQGQMREGPMSQAPPIVLVRRDQRMPLSFAQQRLWFLNQLDPSSPSYNIPLALGLTGPLNVEALAMSLNEILRRHEALRTSFHVVDGLPSQVIAQELSLKLAVVDLSQMCEAERGDEARRLARLEAGRPFDLSRGPLLRACLLRLSDRQHIALLTMHHIVSDGWSMSLLIEEIAALYEAYREGRPSPLSPLPIQYADFAVWQRGWLQGETLDGQISYWKSQLAGAPEVLSLPTDHARPAALSFRGASVGVEISEALTLKLDLLSRREGVTLFMTLLAAFKVVLYRYSGQTDIVVGTPIANRNREEIEGLIGFFVNTLALRTDLSGGPTFRQLLATVRGVALGAYANQDMPFERVVDELKLDRSMSHTPLFQVSFALQNAPSAELRLKGVTLSPLEVEGGVAKYDLTLGLELRGGRITGQVEYSTDLFERETVIRMMRHYERVLDEVATDCEQTVSAIELMSQAEIGQVLIDWNRTEADYPRDKCVHEMFEEQATRTPASVAIVFEGTEVSYSELNERANRLARYLRKEGVGPDEIVGICLRRGVEMMVSVLGVLKAGGAYLPMEPTTPKQRLDFMMEDAGVRVVVTDEVMADKIGADKARAICVDRERLEIRRQSGEGMETLAGGLNLAYVIYTSGSTGSPKGVAVTHQNLVNYTHFICRMIESERNEQLNFATVSAISADLGNTCIFPALISGGCLHILSHDTVADTRQFADYVAYHRIDVLKITPSYLNALLSSGSPDILPGKHLILGGEALPFGLVERVKNISDDCEIINHYGPTETTVGTAVLWPVDYQKYAGEALTVPIGRPIANALSYILDQYYRPVPVGVAGELYIGGDGLARGYINQPELTAERFIPNPFSADAGQRLYGTGDIARYLADGDIEFIGRNDHQVKIRGFRIEMGEVEGALNDHAGVREAVVVAHEEAGGQKRLVGYVAGEREQRPGIEELRGHLKQRLPEYMIPTAFVLLDKLPMTPNGKVDRQALLATALPQQAVREGRESGTETERLVAGIWAEVLGVERVGADENFFDIGGHSLLATQVVSRIREAFNVEVRLRSLFERPTVSGLAEAVSEALRGSGGVTAPAMGRRGRGDEAPLSFAQQRLWFLDKLEPGSAFYNVPAAINVEGELDVEALGRSLNEVVRRHEVLRTRYEERGGVASQVVDEVGYRRLEVIDLSGGDEQERRRQAHRLMRQEAEAGFDLEAGPVVRWKLIKVGADKHVLLVTMHHIASDGWSVGVLLREAGAVYEAYSRGEESPLAELALQYADYAVWQREWLKGEALERQLGYWKEQLGGAAGVLEMPVDRPRRAAQTYNGAAVSARVSERVSEALERVCRDESVTMNMVMLAGLQALLWRYSGQRDISVGTPVAGRNRREVEGLIGFFVNTLVMRTRIEERWCYREMLREVREEVIGGQEHQDMPFEKLVEEMEVERSLSRSPLFQVLFVMQNSARTEVELSGLRMRVIESENDTAKFELSLFVGEEEAGLTVTAEYNTDLFDRATIERLLGHYERLLEGAISDPRKQLSELSLLTESESRQLLVEWNDTKFGYDADKRITDFFDDQVERAPEAVALVCEHRRLSYSELSSRANHLAHHLQAIGVEPGVIVGVCTRRSAEMVIALLAVLKAGGAYVPLDPAYPKQRLAFTLEDSQARTLLTQRELASQLPEHSCELIYLDAEEDGFNGLSSTNPVNAARAGDLAYVIYTSGTTGRPKGVAIEHRSAVAMICWAMDVFSHDDLSGVLASTSICFDLSVFEIFVTLSAGGKVILAENALQLMSLPAAGEVTLINTVPSAMAELVRQGDVPEFVRVVNLAGEPLPNSLAQSVYQMGGVESVYNLYGPSEDTTYSTYAKVEEGSERVVTIGRPVWNTKAYVLDERMQPVPVGMMGELYLAGDGLARGYLERPEQTAERFIPNPFSETEGERMYRSGDLVRYRSGGEIEFVERVDQQVKVRGYRVELGEVEESLNSHRAVREAVVVAGDEEGGKRLIGYVITEQEVSASELRRYLRERLPEYMVPSAFVMLDKLPMTANGKVDRKGLTGRAVAAQAASAGREARTETERLLAGIWAEVLGVERVGAEENFFDIGGHSLLATQVVSRIRETFNLDVRLRSLFERPTVSGLAEAVSEALSGPGAVAVPAIGRRRQADEAPLSFAQQRLWFLDKLEPGSAFYNIPAAIRVEGELDMRALERSLNEVVRRHEVLRTRFEERGGVAVQVVDEASYRGLEVTDLSQADERRREQQAERLMREEAEAGFDLERGPVVRWKLIRKGASEHVLMLTMHHIASDGWSVGVLMREAGALYEAYSRGEGSPLEELGLQYADYAVWQREWLKGEVLERQLGYWRKQLEGARGVSEMPVDRPRQAVQSYSGASVNARVSEEVREGVKRVCRSESVTANMVMLAGMQALVLRYSGERDISVGTPVAGRNRAEVEGLIGFFVNMLVMRTRIDEGWGFREMLREVREEVIGGQEHQDIPFEKLVEEMEVERSLSRSPLFQVTFNFLNLPMEELRLPGLSLSYMQTETQTSKFDLTMAVTEGNGELSLTLNYNSNLFDDSTANRMLGHYMVLLESALANPLRPLSEVSLLTETERNHLLVSLNQTQKQYLSGRLIHQLFEDQAEQRPGRISLVFEGRRLSYGELNSRANQVAHYLKSVNVGPDVPVGVFAERSIEMVVALLAVLKAGGAYVPLDPAYPQERLAFMLRDSHAPVLLTQSHLAGRLPEPDVRRISLDGDWELFAGQSTENCESHASGDNLAYVIYTSGSTGSPKGAMNRHSSILNRLLWMQGEYELTESDSVLQKTTFSFDVSVWEFFWPLMTGARLVLARPGGQQDSQYLVETIINEQITTLHFVPSMLQVFLQQPGVEMCGSLKRVICSGEALSFELQERFYDRLRADLHNLYGPTEAAVDVTYWHCRPNSSKSVVPIGRPIANTQIYILNHAMDPAPTGVYGELHIGGESLARGYLSRPDLTAEKFIPNPFATSRAEHLYRTGDLARFLADGSIEFLRRIDHQVKIRGFRIEPGEVESALRGHPAIEESVVLAREDVRGDKRLVAYIVAGDDSLSGVDELRGYLKERLPEYMIPAAFVKLESIPLTPNGKIDRRALPAPGNARPDLEQGPVAPRNALEALLAQMWREILGVEQVGVHDDFFQLGGDSIKGAVFINRLQEKLNEIVHVVVIFNAVTVAQLAAYINQNYPAAVSRICSDDVDRPDQAVSLDESKVARFRRLIKPLPPRPGGPSGGAKNPPAIFVAAPFQSGSTLFRVMLGGHPRLFAPPELEMLSFNTLQERKHAYYGGNSFWLEGATRAVMEINGCDAEQAKRLMAGFEDQGLTTREFYRQIQGAIGDRILVDKSPSYALDMETLRRAEVDFENALYIHLTRHPLAVIRSFEEARLDQLFPRYRDNFSAREMAALIWLVSHQNILGFLKQVPAHRQHRIRFEDLVSNPAAAIQQVCDFLGLEPHPDMIRPYKDKQKKMTDGLYAESRMMGDVKFHSHSRIDATAGGRWKDYDSRDDFGEVTWELAESLGYERPGEDGVSRRANDGRMRASSRAVQNNGGGSATTSRRLQASEQGGSHRAGGASEQPFSAFASTLVPLQPEGSKPPFFCVHPVGGDVFCYVGLARGLGNRRPFYAFRARGLDEGQTPLNAVEEMAADYVEAMRAAQPEGPYFLGGWSFGGVVAYEMARRLQVEGQTVARLVLIDTLAPQLYDEFDENSAVDKLALMGRFAQDLGLSLDRLSVSPDQVLGLDENEQLALVLKEAKGANVLSAEITTSQAHRLYNVFRSNLRAARKYAPSKYDGRVTLIKSGDKDHTTGDEPAMGWGGLASGELETHTTPGDHYSIITGPDLQMLVEFLKKRLDED